MTSTLGIIEIMSTVITGGGLDLICERIPAINTAGVASQEGAKFRLINSHGRKKKKHEYLLFTYLQSISFVTILRVEM